VEAEENAGGSRLDQLMGRVDSWQKAVIALTALLVAVSGLVGAGLGIWHEVNVSGSTPPAVGPTRMTLPAGQSSTPSYSAQPSLAQSQAPPPATLILPYAERDLSGALTYNSASGPQTLLTYFDVLNEILAGSSVTLAVLDPPAPTTPEAGYARCQGPTANTDTIYPNTLKPGSTLCAFTPQPNNQVFWISFLPPDPNSQSTALRLMVAAWQY
jgi:hypothetical protein